jgi:hypothetical protein
MVPLNHKILKMTNKAAFSPTEIWEPRTPGFDLEPAIEVAQHNMNHKNPAELIDKLNASVQRSDSGIVYALLKGEHPGEYSDTDALVMFNPFANTATANMLVRAEFIREVAKESDVRDEAGKLKPVIMLASPGLHGSNLKLNGEDKKQIRKGDLGPAAREYLKAVSAMDFGHIALLGYSQGADLALAGGASAAVANLDKSVIAIGEPASVQDRGLLNLGKNFMNAGPDIGQRAKDSGLLALNMAQDEIRSDYRNFWTSMIYPSNWNLLARGMSHDYFQANMQTILDAGKINKIVVAYGDRSSITPIESIEPSLAELHRKVSDDRLLTIRVKGGTHAWGEDLTVLAKLYLKALV